MQQVEMSEVHDGAAVVPPGILTALGVANGDRVAFVKKDDGSISLVKASFPAVAKHRMSEIVGVFATREQHSLTDELALLRDIRYGDECDDQAAP